MARKRKVNREGWEPQGKLKIEGIVVTVERRREKTESLGFGEWVREYKTAEALKFVLRDKKKFTETHLIVSDSALNLYGFKSTSYGKIRIPDKESEKALKAPSLIAAYGQILSAAKKAFRRTRKKWELEEGYASMLGWVDQDIKTLEEYSRGLEVTRASSLDRFLPKIRQK